MHLSKLGPLAFSAVTNAYLLAPHYEPSNHYPVRPILIKLISLDRTSGQLQLRIEDSSVEVMFAVAIAAWLAGVVLGWHCSRAALLKGRLGQDREDYARVSARTC
jgi:hypothetical protein